jgi:hypothetical protein
MMISILYGGATSSQLDYIYKEMRTRLARSDSNADDDANDIANGLDGDEDNGVSRNSGVDFSSTQGEYWSIRSEAKRAHNERMEAQRLALANAEADPKQGGNTGNNGEVKESKQSKPTGPTKTNSTANSNAPPKSSGASLLGSLPSLNKGKGNQEAIAYALSLQLPSEGGPMDGDGGDAMPKWNIPKSINVDAKVSDSNATSADIPKVN